MRSLIIVFLLIGLSGFAQENEKRGTIKVRKNKTSRDTAVFDVVPSGYIAAISEPVMDVPPQYRAGEAALQKFISANIRYPQEVRDKKVDGTCYTTFIVNSQGKVSDVSILKGVSGCPRCDEEAIRLIELTGPWIPGTNDGQKISMKYNFPIEFRIK